LLRGVLILTDSEKKSTKAPAIWRYALLVAMQTVGQLMILLQGIPAYRRLLDSRAYEGQIPTSLALWFGFGVLLVQSGYWINHQWGSEIVLRRRVVPGHLILFFARLNIIFFGGLFSATYFLRYDVINVTVLNMTLLAAVLFSGFCYTLELERLGRRLGAGRQMMGNDAK
jgi:hypothetical protein